MRQTLVAESVTLPQTRRIALTLRELPEIAQYGITGPTLILRGRALGTELNQAIDITPLHSATA